MPHVPVKKMKSLAHLLSPFFAAELLIQVVLAIVPRAWVITIMAQGLLLVASVVLLSVAAWRVGSQYKSVRYQLLGGTLLWIVALGLSIVFTIFESVLSGGLTAETIDVMKGLVVGFLIVLPCVLLISTLVGFIASRLKFV